METLKSPFIAKHTQLCGGYLHVTLSLDDPHKMETLKSPFIAKHTQLCGGQLPPDCLNLDTEAIFNSCVHKYM
jgi:hypothetical protein